MQATAGALASAVERRRPRTAQRLLHHGAPVNEAARQSGLTPLATCLVSGPSGEGDTWEVMDVLIGAGADVDAPCGPPGGHQPPRAGRRGRGGERVGRQPTAQGWGERSAMRADFIARKGLRLGRETPMVAEALRRLCFAR